MPVCRLHQLFVSFTQLCSVVSWGQSSILFDHHAAAELLLSGQAQLLHAGVGAGDRAHAPHSQLGRDGEGALCCGLRLLQDGEGERLGLLADVQARLEHVGGGGHGGHGGGVAAGRRRGAAREGGGLQGLMPEARRSRLLRRRRRQGGLDGGSIKDGGRGKRG